MNKRSKEFLNCLGNGKTIYQCEEENNEIDELNEIKKIPKGFTKGICKCGNAYLYCGLDMGLCVKCIDNLEVVKK